MAQEPTILCDVDGILLDFTSTYLQLVEEMFGRKHHESELHSFNYHESIVSKSEDRAIWARIEKTPGLVLNSIPLYEGSMKFLSQLRDIGRVVACTSPASALWTAERATWLREKAHFDRKDIVIASDKSLVVGNYLVDDHFDNVHAWSAAKSRAADDGLGILLSRPWNIKHSMDYVGVRAHDYSEVLRAIAVREGL
jgi:5'(3')-deoxyribonucleotidase